MHFLKLVWNVVWGLQYRPQIQQPPGELADFVYIQEELEKISVAVETLQLWCERMLDTGAIDKDQYDAFKNA